MEEIKMNNIQPSVAISLKKPAIRIHKDTIHMIGDPEYILLSIDIKEKALVITPSIQLDIKAHYIGKYLHNHEKSIVLYSKPLMETFKDINKNLLSDKSYKLYGIISKDKKCVKFKIHEAILIN